VNGDSENKAVTQRNKMLFSDCLRLRSKAQINTTTPQAGNSAPSCIAGFGVDAAEAQALYSSRGERQRNKHPILSPLAPVSCSKQTVACGLYSL